MEGPQDAAQHDVINIAEAVSDHSRTTHPGAQWFPEAGLGLFLHWGLSSVDGNMDLSWGMMANTPYDGGFFNTNKMKPVDYWGLAERFAPDRYKPERWLAAAREAGFRYAVLTTRHHEGYALWPSEYGDFSTRTHMGGRDLLATFVKACRNTGIRAGFYYSPPDWRYCREYMSFNYRSGFWPEEWRSRYPDAHALVPQEPWDEEWRLRPPPEEMPEEFERKFAGYVRGQVYELLGNYGPIDIIWFDGNPFKRFLPITVEEIRSVQPSIVINPRLHGTVDFETPETRLPEERPDGWWEGCFIFNQGGWGYSASEIYERGGKFLDLLAKHRSWNGNLLMNCAPRPDGEMPETYYRRMSEIAGWMNQHSETLFGVSGGPYPEECSVPVTIAEDGTWFLHLTESKIAIVTGRGAPASATVHGSGKPVAIRVAGSRTIFVLRYEDMTSLDDVVAVRW